jgi:hypothetical protein
MGCLWLIVCRARSINGLSGVAVGVVFAHVGLLSECTLQRPNLSGFQDTSAKGMYRSAQIKQPELLTGERAPHLDFRYAGVWTTAYGKGKVIC